MGNKLSNKSEMPAHYCPNMVKYGVFSLFLKYSTYYKLTVKLITFFGKLIIL